MSEEEFSPIRPKSVPLSHVEPRSDQSRQATRALPWPQLGIGVAVVVVLALVFFVIPDLVEPPELISAPPADPATSQPEVQISDPDQPPPFEAVLREQTREKAQTELSRFVELQLKLEQTMQVGRWGQAQLDEAKALATRGDEQFVEEAFEESLQSYRAAGDALESLIEQGQALLREHLATGMQALDDRDQKLATAHYREALTIDPDNVEAETGLARAALLPEIIDLMRIAKNHELAGDFRAALASYEQVQALDPSTHGLAAALASVREGVRDVRFREHLSDGFRAMDSERFEEARRAFNEALALKPGDPVATGGLEQVAERKDLVTIRELRAQAEGFEVREEWRRAVESYESVLALDANIQFAKTGRTRGIEQERTSIILGNIIASPDKLSSKSLYGQAQDVLRSARALEPRGPKLAGQIDRVAELLVTYGTPVPVLFRSDNQTEITLSTVGRLGTFAEKELSLRPGAYTVIGSRDGCRDIRESILVRPDMQPVEIRCKETF